MMAMRRAILSLLPCRTGLPCRQGRGPGSLLGLEPHQRRGKRIVGIDAVLLLGLRAERLGALVARLALGAALALRLAGLALSLPRAGAALAATLAASRCPSEGVIDLDL